MAGRVFRAQLTVATALGLVLATAGTALAAPAVGDAYRLSDSGRMAEAGTALAELHAGVELRLEEANKARVDLHDAQRALARAEAVERAAAGEARSALGQLVHQQERLDELASRSYRQGHRIGQVPATLRADNPREVLRRAEMLDRFSAVEQNVADAFQRAQTAKADQDWRAHRAVRSAEANRAAAEHAGAVAEHAVRSARAAHARQWTEIRRIEANRPTVRARSADGAIGLASGTGERYVRAGQGAPAGSSAEVETVVRRALSQIGISYAWGGGNAAGPTPGVGDGGLADAHGDHQKTGFDCSGLMVYAFAGVGVELAHYSGYQYESGEKVPLSKMRRGDLLFWQEGGRIHHVALYLGENRILEAPYSGERVRVSTVHPRGLAPYAVRLL